VPYPISCVSWRTKRENHAAGENTFACTSPPPLLPPQKSNQKDSLTLVLIDDNQTRKKNTAHTRTPAPTMPSSTLQLREVALVRRSKTPRLNSQQER
jgi:hypothetical protein